MDDTRKGSSLEDPIDIDEVLKRNVPRIVGLAGAAGLGLIGFTATMVEMDVFDRLVFLLTLPLTACGVMAATVVAWFHGEKGPQESNILEWMLLSLIGVAWVMISAWLIVAN